MKYSEIKTKSNEELNKILLDFKKELFNLRFQKKNSALTNTARMSVVKKSIARIKTAMNDSVAS